MKASPTILGSASDLICELLPSMLHKLLARLLSGWRISLVSSNTRDTRLVQDMTPLHDPWVGWRLRASSISMPPRVCHSRLHVRTAAPWKILLAKARMTGRY